MRATTQSQQKAACLMYEYFKSNRALLPLNIATQREAILTGLMQGLAVEEVYAQAIAKANSMIEIVPLKQHKLKAKRKIIKAA